MRANQADGRNPMQALGLAAGLAAAAGAAFTRLRRTRRKRDLGVLARETGEALRRGDFSSVHLGELATAAREAATARMDKSRFGAGRRGREAARGRERPSARLGDLAAVASQGVAPHAARARESVRASVEEALEAAREAAARAGESWQEDVIPAWRERVGAAQDKATEALERTRTAARTMGEAVRQDLPVRAEAVQERAAATGALLAAMAARRGQRRQETSLDGREGLAEDAARARQSRAGASSRMRRGLRTGFSFLFWSGVAIGLLILLFAPRREQRQALWKEVNDFATDARQLVDEFRGTAMAS